MRPEEYTHRRWVRRIGCFGVVTACLLSSAEARARPGFFFGLGLGRGSVSGEEVSTSRIESVSGPAVTTQIDGGINGAFRLGYNILGYVAPEIDVTGQTQGFFDTDGWAAHVHAGLRLYPFWYWQQQFPSALEPVEPSLYIGWGASWQGYRPTPDADQLGFSKVGSMRYGLGVEYFVNPILVVAIDYNYVDANHDTFIFNRANDEIFDISPAAHAGYHQVAISVILHIEPPQGR